MTLETIQAVQEYLTISDGNGVRRKVVDVEPLLKRHPTVSIIKLLREILVNKKKALLFLIELNKSRVEVDQTVGEMFRLHMAIRILEREMEEVRLNCPN